MGGSESKPELLSNEVLNESLISSIYTTPTQSESIFPKKIVIVSVGSRGDVQPYIALGQYLVSKGHSVSIATEKRLESLVLEMGLKYECIVGDSCGALYQPEYQQTLYEGSIFALISMTSDWEKRFDRNEILASYVSALAGADIVITGGLSLIQSFSVAQANGSVWLPMILGPTLPTSEFPIWPLAALAPLSCMNKWTYNFLFKSLWDKEKVYINPWRQNVLNLPPIASSLGVIDLLDRFQTPCLLAFSSLICGPKRRLPSDYLPSAHLGGFVFVKPSEETEIDPALLRFLAHDPLHDSTLSPFNASTTMATTTSPSTGRPIIYLGFGSMPAPDPSALLRLALESCEIAQCRAVIIAGWSQLTEDPKCVSLLESPAVVQEGRILVLKSVPHDWLFPRVQCIVHHCGIGTTAAALRSGRPQVPCPVMLDQPHNAAMLHQLGVAPEPVPYNKKMTSEKLGKSISRVLGTTPRKLGSGTSPENTKGAEISRIYQENAEKIGNFIRKESEHTFDRFRIIIECALPLPKEG